MITLEEAKDLKEGDEIDTDHSLFKGLPKYPVKLRVLSIKIDRTDEIFYEIAMAATWLGITLGRWTLLRSQDNRLTWRLK
jgi:hypothetical protein